MRRAGEWLAAHERIAVAAGLAALTVFYAATTLPNIANHPVVGGDEGWIISASAKLSQEGVFGSDLFAGFFDADRRYYFNLPLHHLILAGVFEAFGVGLEQARLTSAAFGLATLALTYALGRQVGGRWAGLAAAALLVLLRLNLAPFTGLTLTDLGATVRYDLVATPFAVLAALLLLCGHGPPSRGRVALAGLALGLGCLAQFIDAFFVAPLGLFVLGTSDRWRERLARGVTFALAVLAPFLPYFAYIAADYEAFRHQASSVEQERDFLSPGFYLDNLAREWRRYDLAVDIDLALSPAEVAERPSARLALLVAGPLALGYAAARGRRGSAPHALIALVLAALVIEFALLESTKRFVYWVVAVPFLCAALADAGRAVLASASRAAARDARRWAAVAVAAAGVVVALEGAAVGVRNVSDAREAPSYAAAGAAVRALVPSGSTVVTDNRMWLALDDMQVRSLLLLFYWTNPRIAGDEVADVDGAMRRINARFLLLSPLTREILAKLTPADASRFQDYLSRQGRLLGSVGGPPYGPLDVYELR